MTAALGVSPPPATACPTCKDAIAENDPQRQQMVKGYFYSILFMMSMPFVVLGTFGGMAFLSVKRAQGSRMDVNDSNMDDRKTSD